MCVNPSRRCWDLFVSPIICERYLSESQGKCWMPGHVSPCFVLDTWVQCLSKVDNFISSSASRMLMCDAYLGLMTTEKGMSYEPSDILSGYLCEPK